MKESHFVAAAFIAAAFLVAEPAVAAPDDAAPQGNAQAGQQVYRADGCWECHGTVAQGGAISGPRIAATALPYAAFLQQLRVPRNAMPPYEPKILSDADAANIYAYLKSLPPAPSPKSITLLNE